jgi:hypothetical protein
MATVWLTRIVGSRAGASSARIRSAHTARERMIAALIPDQGSIGWEYDVTFYLLKMMPWAHGAPA